MVYVLQFRTPLGNTQNPRSQARFYLGWCEDVRLAERLAEHQQGRGAAITRAAVTRDIPFALVATLPGATQADERRFKRWKNNRHVVAWIHRQQDASPVEVLR